MNTVFKRFSLRQSLFHYIVLNSGAKGALFMNKKCTNRFFEKCFVGSVDTAGTNVSSVCLQLMSSFSIFHYSPSVLSNAGKA